MFRVFLAVILGIFIAFPNAASAKMAVTDAENQYKASLDRSTKLANKSLPLIDRIDAVNSKAQKLGQTPEAYLGPEKFAHYMKERAELHQMYSLQNAENEFTRDLAVIDRLYQAALDMQTMRVNYVITNGTISGFQRFLDEQNIKGDDAFYLKLLMYIEQLVPTRDAPAVK